MHFADSIKTSIALFGRQFEKDGITVEIDLEPDLPLVRADGSRLRQVVVNMISNAHHALESEAGRFGRTKVFRITARRAGKTVNLFASSFMTMASGSNAKTWVKYSIRSSLRDAKREARFGSECQLWHHSRFRRHDQC